MSASAAHFVVAKKVWLGDGKKSLGGEKPGGEEPIIAQMRLEGNALLMTLYARTQVSGTD